MISNFKFWRSQIQLQLQLFKKMTKNSIVNKINSCNSFSVKFYNSAFAHLVYHILNFRQFGSLRYCHTHAGHQPILGVGNNFRLRATLCLYLSLAGHIGAKKVMPKLKNYGFGGPDIVHGPCVATSCPKWHGMPCGTWKCLEKLFW